MRNINMTQQDDFSIYPRAQMLGAIADNQFIRENSTIVDDGATFTFGDALCGGSEDYTSTNFDGSNTFFKGVYIRRFMKDGRVVGGTAPNPAPGTEQLLLIEGCVWVLASNAVKAGEQAALTTANKWAGGAVTGNYALAGATFLTSGDAGDLVKLELTGGRTLTEIS